jgi:hypothetical protein
VHCPRLLAVSMESVLQLKGSTSGICLPLKINPQHTSRFMPINPICKYSAASQKKIPVQIGLKQNRTTKETIPTLATQKSILIDR